MALNYNYNEETFAALKRSTYIYDALWYLPIQIDKFINEMMNYNIEAELQTENVEEINAAFEEIIKKIDNFFKENRGDIKAIMESASIEDVPEDKIITIKYAPKKTEHLLSYIQLEMDEVMEELNNTPIPEEMQELWDQVKPSFMRTLARMQAAIEDGETVISKIKELTKDL